MVTKRKARRVARRVARKIRKGKIVISLPKVKTSKPRQVLTKGKIKIKVVPRRPPLSKQPSRYVGSSRGGTRFKVQGKQFTSVPVRVQKAPVSRAQKAPVSRVQLLGNQSKQLVKPSVVAMIKRKALQQQRGVKGPLQQPLYKAVKKIYSKRRTSSVKTSGYERPSKRLMAVDIDGMMQDVNVYSIDGKYVGYTLRDDPYSVPYSPRFIEHGRVGKTPEEVFEMSKRT